MVLKLFRTPDVILGTTLVGTNLATVTISTLGTLIFIDHFGTVGDLISVIVLTLASQAWLRQGRPNPVSKVFSNEK